MTFRFVGNLKEGRPLKLWAVEWIVVHRLSLAYRVPVQNPDPIPDDSLTGTDIIRAFTETPLGKATGFRPPYHAAILHNGDVEQMLPLGVRGAHARGVNTRSFGICVVGDFRVRPPMAAQIKSLTEVCTVLAPANSGLGIVGHTDLPGSSSDPNKICPGQFLDLSVVRSKALSCIRPVWWPQTAQTMGFEL